ncbi:MAG: L,D-transpeptidase family protein, partial [Planctomyces sp.]
VVVRSGSVAGLRPSAGVESGDWSDISGSAGDLSEQMSAGGQARQSADDQWVGLTEPESFELSEPEAARGADLGSDLDSDSDSESAADGGVRQASWEVEQSASGAVQRALPAELAAGLRKAREQRQRAEVLESHAELSSLYWKYPEQRQLLTSDLRESARVIFLSAERQFSDPHIVAWGETLESIGREYELPWQYLARLNGVEPRELQAGQSLKVVRGPFGAVVDLSAFTLTVHMHGWYVQEYRIGIGQDGRTPTGRFTVREKLENPTWYNPDGGVVEADDPENPLGEYWLGLGDHIGIHGTTDPKSIGRAASRGCLHLGDADIREVFELLGTGSEVVIRR